MYTPHTYPVALLMMLVSMLCWGGWANTQKIDKAWRFELFYWDYMWGMLVCAVLFGLTMGRTNQAAPVSFFHGSFFVSIAAVNPSLTITANALRVGDHLLERLGSAEIRR